MRSRVKIAATMLVAVPMFNGLGPPTPASATTSDDIAINGTYRVTSIGDWAQTNDQYNAEPTVISTWTVSSSCSDAQNCTGTVTSDQGWSAPMIMHDGLLWYVRHDVPNWERCEDGTAYTGRSTLYFYPVDPTDGMPQVGSPTMAGKEKTIGPSGACGQNQWLDIEIPFRFDKIG